MTERMAPPPSKPVVRVILAGSLLSGCAKDPQTTHNPPPPIPPPTTNPPPSLPTWDEVASGHPEGATNPPMPVLEVKDGACYKAWLDPRIAWNVTKGKPGRILGPDEQPTGVQIACPPELLAKVLGGPTPGE